MNLKLYSPGHETNENEHSKKAKIGVSFQYFPSRQLLIVKILGALNLPGRNEKTAPDPYVKVFSLFPLFIINLISYNPLVKYYILPTDFHPSTSREANQMFDQNIAVQF